MGEGNPRFSRNGQPAIAQTAFAEHSLEEGVGVGSLLGCACGKGACLDLASLFLLKVADGRPTPFRLALVPVGCSASRSLAASMLASDHPVRLLPEFPLFRFKVVQAVTGQGNVP
jgi:hypothetical protein